MTSCKSDEPGVSRGGRSVGGSGGVASDIVFPELIWPIDHALDDKVYISNYVDLDETQGTSDYQCAPLHTYDGHTGLDIAALNFRLMDQGIGVIAAADGTVTWTEDFNFDRNYWPPYSGSHNGVVITYPDGAYTAYAHMRKHSIAVKVGEEVKAGDFLGYIGSSGTTPIPHLHFANRDKDNNVVDPFSGSCREGNSFWQDQPNYVANTLKIYDADVFTDNSLEGGFQFGEIKTFKDRPLTPAVYGIDQAELGFWLQLQGISSHQYTITIRKPDESIFLEETYSLETKRRYGWYAHHWDFASVSGQDLGTWTYTISGGVEDYSGSFDVGMKTEYGPRFYPLAGKSIKIGSTSQDVLELHESSPPVTYELINAPAGTTVSGNTVIFGTGQSLRNHLFEVKATDEKGRSDMMYYHLVDLTKPL